MATTDRMEANAPEDVADREDRLAGGHGASRHEDKMVPGAQHLARCWRRNWITYLIRTGSSGCWATTAGVAKTYLRS